MRTKQEIEYLFEEASDAYYETQSDRNETIISVIGWVLGYGERPEFDLD